MSLNKSKRIQMEYRLERSAVGFRLYLFYPIRILRELGRSISAIVTGRNALPSKLVLASKKIVPRVMLVVSDNDKSSGAFRCAVAMAKAINATGRYEVFAVLPSIGQGHELFEEAGVPYTTVRSASWVIGNGQRAKSMPYDLVGRFFLNRKAIPMLIRLIRDYDVDIVHINTIYSYVGALAALATHRRYVWHLRELLLEGKIVDRAFGMSLIGQSDRIIGVSQCVCRHFETDLPAQKLRTVYDGVDVARFYRPHREILQGSQPIAFIMVGNFRPMKGHVVFARACAALYASGCKNFTVTFVGQWVREHVESIFSSSGMLANVSFVGLQSRPEDFLERSDVAFVCSQHEAFGLVTVEAMLSGCVVIGANCAATPELIRDGENGLLFDYDESDVSDLTQKMRYVIEHPDDARRMALKGQSEMRQSMTVENNALNVIGVYDELLRGVRTKDSIR